MYLSIFLSRFLEKALALNQKYHGAKSLKVNQGEERED